MMHLLREMMHSLRTSPIFAVFVLLTLGWAGVIGLMVFLMILQPGFMGMAHGTQPSHRVHDLTYGFLFGVAVLGMLALRPMHGYEMTCLLADEGLADVCPVEQSTLYTYLRNVEARGLVSWTEERVGQRPPRKIFELTPAGEALIHAWLRAPVERMREVRLEFLLKLFFLEKVDRDAHRRLLSDQIEACEAYLVDLDSRPRDSDFRRLVIRSKRSAAEATLGWLKSYAYELEHEVVLA